ENQFAVGRASVVGLIAVRVEDSLRPLPSSRWWRRELEDHPAFASELALFGTAVGGRAVERAGVVKDQACHRTSTTRTIGEVQYDALLGAKRKGGKHQDCHQYCPFHCRFLPCHNEHRAFIQPGDVLHGVSPSLLSLEHVRFSRVVSSWE